MEAVQIRPPLSIARVSSSSLDRRCSSRQLVRIPAVATRKKLSVSMCLSESSTTTPGFDANTSLHYTEEQAKQHTDEPMKSYPTAEKANGGAEMNLPIEEQNLNPKKYAKIHDFCLGIPFGGIVLGGGLFGFLFSRNPASLTTNGVLGGAILAMGFISLKVWRQGLSSLPFMLGQAALAATLVWKHLKAYSLTKKAFPAVFYVAMSAVMLCFYSYVLIAGGNPPPKKKLAASS
ncbi:uncharacterized protein A4U43_C05F21470 [Asparagus officinalis]|uniref:Protein FATTY ACID EXPORT 1, chloroplastic n=1 Tax=Asparagus officinalis TaxID=4686 RepID=A0A5P1ETL1_ASPOF|nr:protein FATTY ACID EXPORT 1, chloroplastic [Asparagus officinalis]XP_020264298.1 protein FATTY ACID EXPORT 1, chloroplastic [Asparagus officinalis]ONK69306.1 uncharacterized protein A4U43_C05F21470 [Asparagus officinalis]